MHLITDISKYYLIVPEDFGHVDFLMWTDKIVKWKINLLEI